MATTIITKHGSGAPAVGDLVQGELAVDLTNKTLYSKDSSGNVFKVGDTGGGSSGTFTDLVATDSFTSPGIDDNATSTAVTITDGGSVVKDTLKVEDPTRPLFSFGETGVGGTPAYISYNIADKELKLTSYGAQDGEIAFETGGSTERMRIDAAGRMLINNTAYSSLGQLVLQQDAENTGIAILDYTASNTFTVENNVASCKFHINTSKDFVFSTRSSDNEIMRISDSGKVGIGTDDPQATLHAKGLNTLSADTGYRKGWIGGAGTWGVNAYEELGIGYSGIRSTFVGSGRWDLTFSVGTSAQFLSGTQPERMRITATGNVGIGTDDPTFAIGTGLHIYSNGYANINLQKGATSSGHIIDFSDASNTMQYRIGTNFFNGGNNLLFATSSAIAMAIDSTGNVGIGVTGANLDESLVVEGDIKIRGPNALWFTNTSGLAGLKATSSINLVLQSNASNGSLAFETNGSERLRIDAAGTTTVTGGFEAARPGAGNGAFAAGYGAGSSNQGSSSVGLGYFAAQYDQGDKSIAIGLNAAKGQSGDPTKGQGASAVAIGYEAGKSSQGNNAVAVGYDSGKTNQGTSSVAVGLQAGSADQGATAVSLGYASGMIGQGDNSIAIGNRAGQTNQGANGIVISSRGAAVNEPGANHIHITSGVGKYLFYNGTNSWEFAGGTVSGGGLRFDSIVQDGAPVVDSLQIIRAFMKLRDAVDDPDSSVEELREKLKVAVVDIIDQFQDQIDTMPVPEEPSTLPAPEEPELGTMPTPETPSTLPAPERPKKKD